MSSNFSINQSSLEEVVQYLSELDPAFSEEDEDTLNRLVQEVGKDRFEELLKLAADSPRIAKSGLRTFLKDASRKQSLQDTVHKVAMEYGYIIGGQDLRTQIAKLEKPERSLWISVLGSQGLSSHQGLKSIPENHLDPSQLQGLTGLPEHLPRMLDLKELKQLWRLSGIERKPALTQAVISLGVVPKYTFPLPNQDGKVAFSDPFILGNRGNRIGVFAFIKTGETVTPRILWRSNSQASWRAMYALENHLRQGDRSHIAKGLCESDTQLPIGLSCCLHNTLQNKTIIGPAGDLADLNFESREQLIEFQKSGGISQELSQQLQFRLDRYDLYKHLTHPHNPSDGTTARSWSQTHIVSDELVANPSRSSKRYHKKVRQNSSPPLPSELKFTRPDLAPAFDEASPPFTHSLPLYGELTGRVIPSRNGEVGYLFYEKETDEGLRQVFLASIDDLSSEVTSYGTRTQSYYPHFLDSPLTDYLDQIPEEFHPEATSDGDYASAWNYVRDIPVIRDYLDSIPPKG